MLEEHVGLDKTALLDEFKANWKQKQLNSSVRFDDLLISMQPSLPAKFVLWLLTRDADFYSSPSGLWSALVQELGLSSEQCSSLMSLSEGLGAYQRLSDDVRIELSRVRASLSSVHTGLNLTTDDMCDVLSAEQTRRFVLWVHANPWCAHMLNSIWQHGETHTI
jgi:hypothetical protein